MDHTRYTLRTDPKHKAKTENMCKHHRLICSFQLNGCTGELLSLARSDSTGSTHSMQHGGVPELLLGLCYNATTGRLSVEVVKGSHFR